MSLRHVQTCSGNILAAEKNNLRAFKVVVKENVGYLYSFIFVLFSASIFILFSSVTSGMLHLPFGNK
jgi:hypothetical protein